MRLRLRRATDAEREEKAICKGILTGNYDLSLVRTFTSEEKAKVDRAVERAIWTIHKESSLLYYYWPYSMSLHKSLELSGILRYDVGLVNRVVRDIVDVELHSKYIKEKGMRLEGIARLCKDFNIKPEDPKVEAAVLGVIKVYLLRNDIAMVRSILHYFPVDKYKLGEAILECEPGLSKRDGFYDPVKIAEQLDVAKPMIEKIALAYHNRLLGEGNDVGAVIAGRDAKVVENESTLDAYQRLLEIKDYKGARRLILESSILTPEDRAELIENTINLERSV
ncbi:MAG: hypothetical protein KGH72_05920 [Candidatus Micrarchaeota archaeon]|nr:hypothetical protein [Candidatus Micrarchaeota archaeon]